MEKSCVNCGNHTWGNDWWSCPPVCLKCKYIIKDGGNVPSNWKHKAMTNADRIRATDDELAIMLHAVKMGYKPWCDYHCENEGDDGCDNCIKKWLQQPAEGD